MYNPLNLIREKIHICNIKIEDPWIKVDMGNFNGPTF